MRKLIAKVTAANPIAYVAAGVVLWAACAVYVVTQTTYLGTVCDYLVGWM